jgi:hypothetical protein
VDIDIACFEGTEDTWSIDSFTKSAIKVMQFELATRAGERAQSAGYNCLQLSSNRNKAYSNLSEDDFEYFFEEIVQVRRTM